MKKLVIALILLFPVFQGFGQNGWREREMEIKIFLRSPADAIRLGSLHLVTESASPGGSVINAWVVPEELEKIRQSGLEFTISIHDLNAHYRNYWESQVPPGYHSYEEIVALADSLAVFFPSICRKEMFGTSLGGRELAALKISDSVAFDSSEPEVLFDGGIHGDEIGGPENMIRFARDLCLGYGNNPDYTELIDTREIWIYYMVNPDGRVNMSRFNNNMVDCNRDFGYMWDATGNSTAPFSQPESKALRSCITGNQPVIYIDYHSGAEILAYPWSYRTDHTRDHVLTNYLAGVYSSTSGYPNLPYGQGYNIMYPINGCTKDFKYGTRGDIGWTMEISTDKQPPSSQILVYYNYNLPAMLEMIRRSGYGLEGRITDSVTGLPVRATVWVNEYFPVYNDPEVGDYHKALLAGSYTVRVTANGYRSKTLTYVGVPSTGSSVRNFQLVPDTLWYAYRVISCRIPGNNPSDEGYTPGALGAPDSIAYSLGKNGFIVLDMGDTVFNGPGSDLRVYESDSSPEGFGCYAGTTPDGPWIFLGNGTGTTSFELGYGSLEKARYIMIQDDGDGDQNESNAGFDLDAVRILTPPLVPEISASTNLPCFNSTVDYTDESSGEPVSWDWSFPGGIPPSSSEQSPAGILYPVPGVYDVSLTISNGFSSASRLFPAFITVTDIPAVELGNDTSILASDTLLLDAGNPGFTYLWSTGETSQTIRVDSAGVGFGTKTVWVDVMNSPSCSASDTIRITFTPNVGTPEEESREEVRVFPNPSGGYIFLEIRGFRGGSFCITSASGIKVLLDQQIPSEYYSGPLELSRYPKGIYFLTVRSDRTIITRKILVD
jgi:PKD repeat protein